MSETSTSPSEVERRFSTDGDAEEFGGYRSVSVLAIVACSLGLFSPLALTHHVALVIPAAAAIFAVVALRRIKASDGALAGSGFAVVGLALAIFFAGWSLSWDFALNRMRTRDADRVASAWLDLVAEGNLHAAHQWMLPQRERLEAGADLDEYYAANHDAAEKLKQQIVDKAATKQVVALGPQPRKRLIESAPRSFGEQGDYVSLLYELEPAGGSAAEIRVVVVAHRSQPPGAAAPGWSVINIDFPQE